MKLLTKFAARVRVAYLVLLRDRFAASAIGTSTVGTTVDGTWVVDVDATARRAYQIADAMMRQR